MKNRLLCISAVIIFILAINGAAQHLPKQNLRSGAVAPDFAIDAINGQRYNLRQLRGKVVVLTFWSTTCQICMSEIPKLNQIFAKYQGKDVVFLALTVENVSKINPFLKKHPFRANIVPNSFGMVLKYANRDGRGNLNIGFPAYFVIDREGLIKHRADGWDKTQVLDSQISRLLTS